MNDYKYNKDRYTIKQEIVNVKVNKQSVGTECKQKHHHRTTTIIN